MQISPFSNNLCFRLTLLYHGTHCQTSVLSIFVQFISHLQRKENSCYVMLNSFSYACPPKISPLRARCRGIRQGFEQARTLAHYTRIWLLGFVPYSHSIAIFFCGVVAWKATFLCPYAPIRLWSKANSASLISYTL